MAKSDESIKILENSIEQNNPEWKDLYKPLKSNSSEMITSRYEQQVVWEVLLEEYKELLKMERLGSKLDPEINLLA
jgi:hypothetical protein